MASKNYESEIQSKGVDKAITVDDISTDVFTTGSSITFKSVWNAIRACIRAIIHRFDDVDADIQGAQGTFTLTNPADTSDSWQCTKELKITGLTRKYTRGFFAFYTTGTGGTNVFGVPSLWTENMPDVRFYDQALAYPSPGFKMPAYFAGTRSVTNQSYLYLTSFKVQHVGNSNDITITFDLYGKGYNISSYELRYALF